MGTHARPRTRARSAALGTLAVGATLTGVGLTAAAFDPVGPGLAEGAPGIDPVNFTADGLGAPVPVANVSVPGGSGSAPGGNAAGTSGGGTAGTSTSAGGGGHGADGSGAANAAGPRHARPISVNGITSGSITNGSTAAAASAAAAQTWASNGTSAGSATARTASSRVHPVRILSGNAGGGGSAFGLPAISGLSSTVDNAKSAVADLLGDIARLV